MKYFIYDKTGEGYFQFFEVGDTIPTNAIAYPESCSFIKPFYNGTTIVEGAVQSDFDKILQAKVKELKQLQNNDLAETDWYIIRKMDTGVEVPAEIETLRNNIRQKYNDIESELL